MKTSNTLICAGHCARLALLMTVAICCARIGADEQRSEPSGGLSSTGGSNTGAITTGGRSAGGSSVGGNAIGGSIAGASATGGTHAVGSTTSANVAGGSHLGGTSAAANVTGGSHLGGTSAAANVTGGSHLGGTSAAANVTGGSSTGGSSAGDAGSCVNVCSLYGPACCIWSEPCIAPGGSCVIDVLSGSGLTSGTYANLEQKIAALPPDALVSIRDVDIAWAAADPPLAARMELHLTSQASSLYGSVLDNIHDGQAFRFSCGGLVLYVGVVYNINGAAAFNLPVLYATRDGGNLVVLQLSAWQSAWYGSWSVWGDEPGVRERFDRPEFRAVMCLRGALSEFGADAGPMN
jgi:hypothetical protein